MRPDLARRLLGDVLGCDGATVADSVADLLALARVKYDSYLGYRHGARFFESLLGWLVQFEPRDRAAALRFVRDRLVFVSRAELHHLVELVYPTVVRPALLQRASARTGLPLHRTVSLASSAAYTAEERATLVLGLSDGAVLDVLRRVTPEFRHEQLSAVPELTHARVEEMLDRLEGAQAALGATTERRFGLVLLVDDFSATATTLLRREEGQWQGRLWSVARHLAELRDREALAPDHDVRVVLYVATETAERRLRARLARAGLGWAVDVLQRIGDGQRVTAGDADVFRLCRERAPGTLAFGCGDAALAVVLHHNSPDNSVAVIWQDAAGAGGPVPLFARYERYPAPPGRASSSAPQPSPSRRAT